MGNGVWADASPITVVLLDGAELAEKYAHSVKWHGKKASVMQCNALQEVRAEQMKANARGN